MIRNTKLLILALLIALFLSVGYTYYKTVVLKDFSVINVNYEEAEEIQNTELFEVN
jgi:hypothetical protein